MVPKSWIFKSYLYLIFFILFKVLNKGTGQNKPKHNLSINSDHTLTLVKFECKVEKNEEKLKKKKKKRIEEVYQIGLPSFQNSQAGLKLKTRRGNLTFFTYFLFIFLISLLSFPLF